MKVWDRGAHLWAVAGAVVLAGMGALFFGSGKTAVGVAAVAGAVVWYAALMRRSFRRTRLAKLPVPAQWKAILEKNVPQYRRLGPERRAEFERDVGIFVRENSFRGVDVEVTDELKVLAAASGVLLLFGRTDRDYPKIGEILFYPQSFGEDYKSKGDVAGLVHPHGTVVFSVPELRRSFASAADGYHVGLHEFAHLLDLSAGDCDGLPLELDPKLARPWCALMKDELEKIRRGRGVLRAYGGTNEAEFWAVAVETYFERPEILRKGNPDLYAVLDRYFGLNRING